MGSTKQVLREKRHARIRAKIKGTSARPRLIVFRSSAAIYAQLIDDEKRKTITSVSDLKIKNKEKKVEKAKKVGLLIAEKAKELKIDSVVFDRAGYKYHGRVKALAEGAREGGLKF
ncbi:MAG: 50S ribosomal protein L18 [Candidatus Gracilibacteria bacterium]|jgi:large subunit ribosomal protein L18